MPNYRTHRSPPPPLPTVSRTPWRGGHSLSLHPGLSTDAPKLWAPLQSLTSREGHKLHHVHPECQSWGQRPRHCGTRHQTLQDSSHLGLLGSLKCRDKDRDKGWRVLWHVVCNTPTQRGPGWGGWWGDFLSRRYREQKRFRGGRGPVHEQPQAQGDCHPNFMTPTPLPGFPAPSPPVREKGRGVCL